MKKIIAVSFQPCNGCFKDHEIEDCQHGNNTVDLSADETVCHLCGDIFAIEREDGTFTCFECFHINMIASEDYPLGGSIEPHDIEVENELTNEI